MSWNQGAPRVLPVPQESPSSTSDNQHLETTVSFVLFLSFFLIFGLYRQKGNSNPVTTRWLEVEVLRYLKKMYSFTGIILIVEPSIQFIYAKIPPSFTFQTPDLAFLSVRDSIV